MPSGGASYKYEVLSPRELPANEGEQAASQTLYESSAKPHRPAAKLPKRTFRHTETDGSCRQVVPATNTTRRQLVNCLPMKENRPLMMLRCLEAPPLQWQRQGPADKSNC